MLGIVDRHTPFGSGIEQQEQHFIHEVSESFGVDRNQALALIKTMVVAGQ
jgi:hypothetical protein